LIPFGIANICANIWVGGKGGYGWKQTQTILKYSLHLCNTYFILNVTSLLPNPDVDPFIVVIHLKAQGEG